MSGMGKDRKTENDMNITRKNFFIGSAAAFAASGLKAATPNPVGKIQGFNESIESKTDGP